MVSRNYSPKHPKKTGVFKPCKQCGTEFEPQSRWNVYCQKCNKAIENRSIRQVDGGVW